MYTANSNITFISLPLEPNVKITFGDDVQQSLTIRFYSSAPPNKFHRWMVRKLLGIRIELI